MSKVEVSIILPCYNEGPTFEVSVAKIMSVLKKLKYIWEIIFVEDKSQDSTKENIEKLTSKIKSSRAIYHSKNQGRGKSVADGVKIARGDICGFLDVDLEISADYIPLFISEIKNGSDLVIGQRFYEGDGTRTFVRFLASKIYAFSVRMLFNSPAQDTESGYKFFRKSKILTILGKIKNKHWFWDTEICIRSHLAGLKISQVPVLFRRREDKKSTVRLIPDSIDYISNLIRLKAELAKS